MKRKPDQRDKKKKRRVSGEGKGAKIDEDRVSFFDGAEVFRLLKAHRSQMALIGQMKETYETLNSADADLGLTLTFTPQGMSWGIVLKRAGVAPIPMTLKTRFPSTPEGRKKSAEFAEFLTTGAPIELEPEFIEGLDAPQFIRGFLPDCPFRFSAGQPRGTISHMSLHLISGETEAVHIKHLEMRSRRNGDAVTFTNEMQRVPFRFSVTIHDDGSAAAEYSFTYQGGLFKTLLTALQFQAAVANGMEMVLTNLDTDEKATAKVAADPAKAPNPRYLEIVRKVVDIANRTGVSIPVPDRRFFTADDIRKVNEVTAIISTGRLTDNVSSVTLHAQKPLMDAAVLAEKLNGDAPVLLEYPEAVLRLMDTAIPLGPWRVVIPAARIMEEDIAKARAAGEKEIAIRVISGDDSQPITVEYSKWLPAG